MTSTSAPALTRPGHAGSVRASSGTPPRHRGRWWFVAICFGWSWLSLLVAKLVGASLQDLPVQLLTVAMVPALTAVVVRVFITKEGFADAGLRPRFRTAWRSYLAALLIPIGVLLVGLVLAALTGAWSPDHGLPFSELVLTAATGPVLAVLAAPLFWGEEFGWTSYMRDRLLPGRPLATTFLTGLIWGVWHFPLPWVGYFGHAMPTSQLVGSMLMWVPLSILLEYLIGWLWQRTGSIWPGALLHSGCNLGAAVGLEKVFAGHVSTVQQTAIYCCALAPFVLWVVARGRLERRRSVSADRRG